MDKKGFLLGEETLKMILAVVCLGFLVYFLAALYFSKIDSQKEIQAQETISRISDIVKNNQVSSESLEMLNPSGWFLFGFVGNSKPNVCVGENCLCLCKKVKVDDFWGFISSRQLQECSKDGFCLIVERLNSFEPIKIEKAGKTSIILDKTNGVEIKIK
jgi:hypothetical protein